MIRKANHEEIIELLKCYAIAEKDKGSILDYKVTEFVFAIDIKNTSNIIYEIALVFNDTDTNKIMFVIDRKNSKDIENYFNILENSKGDFINYIENNKLNKNLTLNIVEEIQKRLNANIESKEL